jgi:hypothetical protein
MNAEDKNVTKLSDGEIVICVDGDRSLHIKCVTKFGDPVELNFEEVKELCAVLEELAKIIE